jgi:hypothetical protein
VFSDRPAGWGGRDASAWVRDRNVTLTGDPIGYLTDRGSWLLSGGPVLEGLQAAAPVAGAVASSAVTTAASAARGVGTVAGSAVGGAAGGVARSAGTGGLVVLAAIGVGLVLARRARVL